MKTICEYFTDWESNAFGYGYGTGEEHIIPALRNFFLAFKDDLSYRHEDLERAVTPAVAWLFINVLCRLNVIEYGTSPRYGWLTRRGIELRSFVVSKSTDELYELTSRDESYCHCGPDYCNCDDELCTTHNPFWNDMPSTNAEGT